MTDPFAGDRRSALMRSVRGSDAAPEKDVQKLLRAIGVGFRLHRRDLPGTPDIVIASRRTVIFVHGCFWHRRASTFGLLKIYISENAFRFLGKQVRGKYCSRCREGSCPPAAQMEDAYSVAMQNSGSVFISTTFVESRNLMSSGV